jgi:hypothetical protein
MLKKSKFIFYADLSKPATLVEEGCHYILPTYL